MRARAPAHEAVFKPLERPATTVEETVTRLGTAIRLGVLPPGSRLPSLRDLAHQLSISRCTLQQGLTTLVENGHLVSRRGGGGGTFVAEAPPLSVDNGAQPFEVDAWVWLDQRVAIETGATVLAAERAQPADLARLAEAIERIAAATAFEEYHRADVLFHIRVAEATHSPRLVTAMTEVHGHVTDLIARIPHPQERLTRSNDQHRRLVTLLRLADSRLAVLAMREHLEQTERVLVERSGVPPVRA